MRARFCLVSFSFHHDPLAWAKHSRRRQLVTTISSKRRSTSRVYLSNRPELSPFAPIFIFLFFAWTTAGSFATFPPVKFVAMTDQRCHAARCAPRPRVQTKPAKMPRIKHRLNTDRESGSEHRIFTKRTHRSTRRSKFRVQGSKSENYETNPFPHRSLRLLLFKPQKLPNEAIARRTVQGFKFKVQSCRKNENASDCKSCPRITKRSHALSAPVPTLEFKARRHRKITKRSQRVKITPYGVPASAGWG